MKRILPVFIALLAFSTISFVGGLDQDYTGGPTAPGNRFCGISTCHGGNPGEYNPNLLVQVLEGDSVITEYVPGETYRLKVRIEATNGTPEGYGFQAVALDSENQGAGEFSNPGEAVRIYLASSRPYATHSTRSDSSFFEVDWIAPEEGSGEVQFWVAGNAVNGNNANSGDNAIRLTEPILLQESLATPVREISFLNGWSLFPNPVGNGEVRIELQSKTSRPLNLRLLAVDGRVVLADQWRIQEGTNTRFLDMSGLPGGVYALQLWTPEGVSTRRIFKR